LNGHLDSSGPGSRGPEGPIIGKLGQVCRRACRELLTPADYEGDHPSRGSSIRKTKRGRWKRRHDQFMTDGQPRTPSLLGAHFLLRSVRNGFASRRAVAGFSHRSRNGWLSSARAHIVASIRDYPDHVVINMTKEQLVALPAFKYLSDNNSITTRT
jgi:hypothetical protein